MKELNKKYTQNSITPEELHQLNNKLSMISNLELEDIMMRDWDESNIPIKTPTKCHDVILNHINKSKNSKKTESNKKNSLKNIVAISLKIAAVVIFMAVSTYTLYLHKEVLQMTSQTTIISTNKGEKTTVSLPDGSSVVLNELSNISFNPADFNNNVRSISFNGEGYFNIKSSPSKPFIVNSDTVSVRVMGTIFNLLSRTNINIVELELLEGCVIFSSLLDSTTYKLSPSQKILHNKALNSTKIIELNNKNISSWRESRLIFKAADLNAVLKAIEDVYGVEIEIIGSVNTMTDLFTGAITKHDLEIAIATIEKVYHLDAAIAGKRVFLRAN